jgi:RNA polymerase sigma-70 factor (ECF subfamily)
MSQTAALLSIHPLKNRHSMKDPERMEQMQHFQDLMAKVANSNDKNAFSELFDHFAPRIKSFCLSSFPGSDLIVDDLVQEVMIKVWNKAHMYKPEVAAVSTWIFTLARNTRIDQIRKDKNIASEIDSEFLFETLEDETQDPFRDAQIMNTEAIVQASIDELPSEQAEVIRITFLEGKSHSEAAKTLNLPLGTVKSRARIAMGKLKVTLSGVNND